MVINANSGPSIQFGITTTSTGGVQQYNEDRGPSVDDLGAGLLDPRPFYNYKPGAAFNPNSSAAAGFSQYQTMSIWDNFANVDYIPSAASSNALISNSQPVSNTAITLTSTGASVFVTTITAPESGAAASVTAIDSTAAYVSFGQSGQICSWNPAAGTGRTISINLSSNGDGGTFSVAGRDMYGFKMTELLTAGSTQLLGKKAFKYVSSVVASTTITSTGVTVGYNDVYGWPCKLSYIGQNAIVTFSSNAFTYNGQAAQSSATVVLASTVATQTSTTPDVRGTYASTFAFAAAFRVQLTQYFTPAIMAAITPTDQSALFGATQFSSV